MAPEGAILSVALDGLEVRGRMNFKARSRPDNLLAGAGSSAKDPCARVFVLLVVGLIRAVG